LAGCNFTIASTSGAASPARRTAPFGPFGRNGYPARATVIGVRHNGTRKLYAQLSADLNRTNTQGFRIHQQRAPFSNRAAASAGERPRRIARGRPSIPAISVNVRDGKNTPRRGAIMGVIGGLYTVQDLPVHGASLRTDKGQVKQKNHLTKCLNNGEYLWTMGLGSCTALILWDAGANVVSLAHFDGTQSTRDIEDMVNEMIELRAVVANIRFAMVGTETNQTLISVWNDLDPRLNPPQRPQLRYPPPDPPDPGPPNVYLCGDVAVSPNGNGLWIGQVP
jgi:hypothetical protein